VPAGGLEPGSGDGGTATQSNGVRVRRLASRTPPAARIMLLAGTVASILSLSAKAQEAPKSGWEFFITPYA